MASVANDVNFDDWDDDELAADADFDPKGAPAPAPAPEEKKIVERAPAAPKTPRVGALHTLASLLLGTSRVPDSHPNAARLPSSKRDPKFALLYTTPELSNNQAKSVDVFLPNGLLLAKQVVLAILADNSDVDEHMVLRYSWKHKGVWRRVSEGAVFPVATDKKGEEPADTPRLVFQVGRGALPEPWIHTLVTQYRNEPPVSAATRTMTMRAVATTAQLGALSEAVARNYDPQVAARLVKYLSPLCVASWRRNSPGGVLFYGPPGTGKSTLCGLIVEHLNLTDHVLFSGTAADLNSRYVGDMEKKLRSFAVRAQLEPFQMFVIILDEVHTLAKDQKASGPGSGGEHKKDALVVLLDIMASCPNILFLACTNFRSQLDAAFTRSKRMSRHVLVPPLSRAQREAFFERRLVPILSQAAASSSCTKEDFANMRNIFGSFTCNFSRAQMADLLSAIEVATELPDVFFESLTDMSVVQENSLDVDRWEAGIQEDSKWLAVLLDVAVTVAETSDATRSLSRRLHMPMLDGFPAPILDVARLQELFENNRDAILPPSGLNGRLQVSVASQTLTVEGWETSLTGVTNAHVPCSYNTHFQRQDDHYISIFIQALMQLLDVTTIEWVGRDFASANRNDFEDALIETVDVLTSTSGTSCVIIDMDEIVGMVPTTFTVQAGSSRQAGMSMSRGLTEGTSISRGLSLGSSQQRGISNTITRSSNITRGQTASESASATSTAGRGSASGESRTSTTGRTKTSGWSGSVSMVTPFSKNYSSTKSESLSISQTHSTNEFTSTAQGKSSTKGTSLNRGEGEARAQGSSEMSGSSMNVSTNVSENQGRSATAGQSRGNSNSASRSVTVQMQYPKHMNAVMRLVERTNHRYHRNQPYVLLLYRVVDPAALTNATAAAAMDAAHPEAADALPAIAEDDEFEEMKEKTV